VTVENQHKPSLSKWRERWSRIVFYSDTPAGKAFDVILLWIIGLSVVTVMLESVAGIRTKYAAELLALEWGFTILFTIEYGMRLYLVRRKTEYVLSFFGIVDLLSVLPTYLALFLPGSQYLMVLRVLRMLRMFRILKMARHITEASILLSALRASRPKIAVFLFSIMAMIAIEATLMYLIESPVNEGFSNIPQAIYWGIVTLTTVGYGDVAPITVAGKILASIMMLTGFSIIAVPTGIVTAELGREAAAANLQDQRQCRECGLTGHDRRAFYCFHCGSRL
jgi:voltage-gated potassium channel